MSKIDDNKHFLYPSTLFTNKEAFKVVTILGSCISVCLYDSKKKMGGINHYMLPLWNGDGLATPKFGNVAITKLIKSMENMGCNKRDMVAKVFGGANQSCGVLNIGGRNAQVAFEMLKDAEIKVVAKSVGGSIGRKIIFDTYTSEVLMKYVKKKGVIE